jgi:transglutaminase-like putative cysteine protease
VGAERNPLRAARKLYDWTLDNVDSWVKSPATSSASTMGSSEHCLARKTGGAGDFHSLYAALARAADIPTRILYGSLLAPGAEGTDVDARTTCWVEIFAPEQGWIPIDVAEADLFAGPFALTPENEPLVRASTAAAYHGPDPERVRYCFGNLGERRVLWSIGRDLELEPRTASGAVNALPKACVEIDGARAAETAVWKRTLKFEEL